MLQLLAMNQRLASILITLLLILPVNFASAQAGLPDISSENNFSLVTSPNSPGANQLVVVTVTGNSQTLSNANITWYLDGIASLSGVGAKNFSFITKSSNGVSNIKMVMRLSNGETVTKNLIVTPAEIDLIWEAVSYTPPFYKGKGLFARQSQVKIVAIPHLKSGGSEVPATQLIYNWKKNGENVVNASGYGKDVYQFQDSIISRPSLIELEVTDSSLGRKASGSIVISPIEPRVVMYENHPLYGLMLNQNISNSYNLFRKEINVWAAPFYFATKTQNSPILNYRWSINNTESPEQNNKRAVIFRAPDEVAGQSQVSVEINNIDSILQFAEGQIRFNFNTREDSTSFGNL